MASLYHPLSLIKNDLKTQFCNIHFYTFCIHLIGTKCAPVFTILFLYCYQSHSMAKLPGDQHNHSLINSFNKKFTYLDDILTVNSANLFTSVEESFAE